MSKLDIMNKLTRTTNKLGLQLKKHSPEILVGAGIVGTVATTVIACKATTKVSAIVEDTKSQMALVNKSAEAGQINTAEGIVEYTEEDKQKDTIIIYTQSAVKIFKLYAPAVALGTLSITSILVGHNMLRKRHLALAAAYTTIDRGFKEYRSRVVERFGDKVDKELRYNVKAEKVEEKIIDPKTGEEKTVEKTIEVADPNMYSMFARFFDETCAGFSGDAGLNKSFLLQQQNYANELLKAQGHLFLNEVYDMLGMQRDKIGAQVGWYYNEKNPVGDNYVDFGIFDMNKKDSREFVNGFEKAILLDYNVDGDILDLI